MAREVLPRVHIYSLALIVSAFHRASSSTASPVDCTRFDIAELEDYLSKVHPEDPAATDTMIGKFTSTVTELPFGALKSDWSRLLLLQRAQPEGSILREKLGRLFRILAAAYSETVEPSDITKPVFSATSGWDAFTNRSTETSSSAESLTSTIALSNPEESSRTTKIDLTTLATSDTTKSYVRFGSSTLASIVAPTPFDANTFATNARSTTQTSSDQKFSIHNFDNSVKNDDPAVNGADKGSWQTDRSATQERQEINGTKLSPIATASAFDATTTRPSGDTTETEGTSVNLKVEASDEKRADDPTNKRQGIKMTAEKEESSDHFRGTEQIGGFVAGKSSVAGAVDGEDARPITSPVSETDTPFTPVGGDFSASWIRDHGPGTMNVGLAEGIKELDSAGTASTEIARADPGRTRGREDPAAVYALMNSEDQENTAGKRGEEYRGSVNTSDPVMLHVKTTTIGRSRVHTDRIRENEVPGLVNDFHGRQPVYRKDGGHSAPGTSPRSIQNSAVYRVEIREPSVPGGPKVGSEFSSRAAVIPRVVTSTIGSAGDRPDQWRDNWSRIGRIESKKPGSSDTGVEETFRWFYNAGAAEDRDSKQRGIRIECDGNGHREFTRIVEPVTVD
ncbi:uncharacterized protein LOC117219302 [Megalopta genalis]|uniref:uncharacterized protein LOC117219302 n=1 Tax=Megalopta genalis TaxID=115081 RepID=UPI003FD01B61